MLQHGLDMDWVTNFRLTALALLIIRAPAWCPSELGYALIHDNAEHQAEIWEESNTMYIMKAVKDALTSLVGVIFFLCRIRVQCRKIPYRMIVAKTEKSFSQFDWARECYGEDWGGQSSSFERLCVCKGARVWWVYVQYVHVWNESSGHIRAFTHQPWTDSSHFDCLMVWPQS